jgi:ABC-2 type transport system permease protein
MSGIQLIGNQFGYDRAGFRVYVLCPAPRREILIGKNLAVAPMTLGMSLVAVLLIGCVFPMRVDRWLAAFLQVGSTYLVFCLLANRMSIFAPLPIAAGSMQASNPRLTPVLIQMLCLMIFPVLLVPILLPLGLEVLLEELEVVSGWPISLALSLGVFAGAVALYRSLITWQGELFAAREQKILEVVTSKLE